MAGNSFGNILRLTTYGESHGFSMGGILDGVPAGIKIDQDLIQKELDRRKPGQSSIVTQRKESDTIQIKSGIFEGKTTGMPIAFEVLNADQKSKDYSHIKNKFRPSHADFTYDKKYGHRDYRGGGRSSARETVSWVAAGAIAKQIISFIKIKAFTFSVGKLKLDENREYNLDQTESNIVRCPDQKLADKMIDYIKSVRKQGDTVGGQVKCIVENVPLGLGDPVFEKLHANLAKAMMSINAVKGFEYGSGFSGTEMFGSEHNDIFEKDGRTQTNNSGGIQGGISNGMPIYFKIAFKPVATLMTTQDSINDAHEIVEITGKGRHDPCVVPRAIPIVEAMTALVLADAYLLHKTSQI